MNIKNGPGLKVRHRGVVIFVSNEDAISDDALHNRLKLLFAEEHIGKLKYR